MKHLKIAEKGCPWCLTTPYQISSEILKGKKLWKFLFKQIF